MFLGSLVTILSFASAASALVTPNVYAQGNTIKYGGCIARPKNVAFCDVERDMIITCSNFNTAYIIALNLLPGVLKCQDKYMDVFNTVPKSVPSYVPSFLYNKTISTANTDYCPFQNVNSDSIFAISETKFAKCNSNSSWSYAGSCYTTMPMAKTKDENGVLRGFCSGFSSANIMDFEIKWLVLNLVNTQTVKPVVRHPSDSNTKTL